MNAPVTYGVVAPVDIERGAVCMDCGTPFRPGDRYATRLAGMIGETPVTEVICLACDPS
jgi:RNase P subunit RPR2